MDELDWMSGDEWPEAFGIRDIAKGVLMPHTAVLGAANRIVNRGGSGGKVVTHTQPPPVATNAREVQGQMTGLLRTVKALEEKVDETTRQLALLNRGSSVNQDAERFQHSLTQAVVSAAPLIEQRNWVGAATHLVPVVQNGKGMSAAVASKPISTFAWPLAAAGAYLLREPREPLIIITDAPAGGHRATFVSPDGGAVYYAIAAAGAAALPVNRNSLRWNGQPVAVAAGETVTARTYVFFRGSDTANQVAP